MTARGFPACLRGVSAQGAVKAGLGPVAAPAVVAGTTVGRGDVIVADDDGVLCAPAAPLAHTRPPPPQPRRKVKPTRRT
ncbi:hypothetical protein [Streptomyces regalis]|uniref:RraA family protein n=1 Tax=Streptomyces regalis TaxID=68262 RepID=UPI00099EC73E